MIKYSRHKLWDIYSILTIYQQTVKKKKKKKTAIKLTYTYDSRLINNNNSNIIIIKKKKKKKLCFYAIRYYYLSIFFLGWSLPSWTMKNKNSPGRSVSASWPRDQNSYRHVEIATMKEKRHASLCRHTNPSSSIVRRIQRGNMCVK
jgi:hypothetical protein